MDRKSAELDLLRQWLAEARYPVFFGGAGMSTESGIPDFRSPDGLYAEKGTEYYLSRTCLQKEPEEFYRFFRDHMLYPKALPNAGHKALARLEERDKMKAVITQNIDGFHQKAGSRRVIELHGSARSYTCSLCRKHFDGEMPGGSGVPRCPVCGGVVRPDITLYGEPLDGFAFEDARREVAQADLLIVGGTSLTVHPAASLLCEFLGPYLVIVNQSPTPWDSAANLIIRRPLGEVLPFLTEGEDR